MGKLLLHVTSEGGNEEALPCSMSLGVYVGWVIKCVRKLANNYYYDGLFNLSRESYSLETFNLFLDLNYFICQIYLRLLSIADISPKMTLV